MEKTSGTKKYKKNLQGLKRNYGKLYGPKTYLTHKFFIIQENVTTGTRQPCSRNKTRTSLKIAI
jgi:hypothetical protein